LLIVLPTGSLHQPAPFAISPASDEVETLAQSYMSDPDLVGASDDRPARHRRVADRAGADARPAGHAILSMNLMNVALDLWFVLGLGWGVEGGRDRHLHRRMVGAWRWGSGSAGPHSRTRRWRDWARVFDPVPG
jgi:MATE family multidrug resistance protein